MHFRSGGKRVSQPVYPGVEQADDVACPCLLHRFTLIRHELLGLLERHDLVSAGMPHFHALFKGTGNNPHKGEPIPVSRVHVRLDLEDETGKIRFFRPDDSGVAFPGQRRGREGQEPVQERLHTEVGNSGTKEHGRQFARPHLFQVKGVSCFIQQFHFLRQPVAVMLLQHLFQFRIINADVRLFNHLFTVITAGVQFHHPGIPVIYALEVSIYADGPVDGAGTDAQHLLQLFHQGEGILRGPVHLVYKGENRDVPHPADLEQLDGLCFDALCGVQQHNRCVRGNQYPVGIFREVLVAGGVQDVDPVSVIHELHGGACHGNTALLLNLHPVRSGVLVRLPGFNAARTADCSAVQQQLFSQRGFTRVRMGDNGKGTPLLHLFVQKRPELPGISLWQHNFLPLNRLKKGNQHGPSGPRGTKHCILYLVGLNCQGL